MAREAAVVYKGVKPLSERYPSVAGETVSDLRELMASAEPKVRNLFQQSLGIRLKHRDDAVSPLPDAIPAPIVNARFVHIGKARVATAQKLAMKLR